MLAAVSLLAFMYAALHAAQTNPTPWTRILQAGIFLLVLSGLAIGMRSDYPFPWKINLSVGETAVSGFDGKTRLNARWNDLIFLHYEVQEKNHLLFLSTLEEDFVFSLNRLPATDIWDTLRRQANPSVLGAAGWEHLSASRARQSQTIDLPLAVQPTRFWYVALALSTLFFLLLAAISGWQELWPGVLFFLAAAALSIYTFSFLAPVTFDRETIHYTPWRRRYQIRWDEITEIEFDPQGGAIVFRGHGKQVVIPGFLTYSQTQNKAIGALLDNQKQKWDIQIKESWKASFRRQRNTRTNL